MTSQLERHIYSFTFILAKINPNNKLVPLVNTDDIIDFIVCDVIDTHTGKCYVTTLLYVDLLGYVLYLTSSLQKPHG